MTLSHTAKHAAAVESFPSSHHGAYLKARGAIYHADRSSDKGQVFYSPVLRSWLKLYSSAPGVITSERHVTCPCSLVG